MQNFRQQLSNSSKYGTINNTIITFTWLSSTQTENETSKSSKCQYHFPNRKNYPELIQS